jgi:hypothetical protein
MAIKQATIQIYIYEGTLGNYTSNDLAYTLSKDRISSKDNILFEIADLVRDYIEHNFNNDYLSATKWVTVSKTLIKEETNAEYISGSPEIENFILIDGYGEYEEEINPQLSDNALISATDIYIPEGTAGKFAIFAEGVGKVTIDSADTEITDSGNSNQKIQYITIPADSSTIQVYDTDDTTLLKTVTVHNICEPKFTSYKATFVNKYGAYQDVYFFKKSTETFAVEDDTYKVNNINSSTVSYPTYQGQRQRYGVNSQTSLQMNTGFIKESAVSTIEELFLSENVWLRFEGKTLPIIPKSKSFTQKTSLNDKLINYTIDFDFAFNKINNVR